MSGLFAYGTLLFTPILRAVVGRELRAVEATLDGFVRRRVIGELFPAIVEAPGERVEGVLYEEVDGEAWRLLDAFEGALYERRAVTVTVTAGAPSTLETATSHRAATPRVAPRAAFTYVLSESCRDRLGPEPWSPERFAHDHLAAFAARLDRAARPPAGSLD